VRTVVVCLIGAVSAVAIAVGYPASADSLKSVVRTLNAIVNPEDAWRLEDQARRYHRTNEERYWRNYGAGLEQQRRERGELVPPRGEWHGYSTPIDAMVILPRNTIGVVIAKGLRSPDRDGNCGRPGGLNTCERHDILRPAGQQRGAHPLGSKLSALGTGHMPSAS